VLKIVRQFVIAGLCSALVNLTAIGREATTDFFARENLKDTDSVLLTQGNRRVVYQWQADKLLVPASLMKLVTSYAAIQKWGLDKRFETHFFRHENTLWVQGFGDPYLVSEELDRVAKALRQQDLSWIDAIAIDGSYFKDQQVPGRSKVADPYNAPLAAVSANFNTAQLRNTDNTLYSAEPQTPLTDVAVKAAKTQGRPESGKRERVNLVNADNAALNVAQILAAKLKLNTVRTHAKAPVPDHAERIYTHVNSHNLADIIRGTLEYSNNFMANQTFLMLAGEPQAEFSKTAALIQQRLREDFGWGAFSIVEGAGLSRKNRLSAVQLNDLLTELRPIKDLFKGYDIAPDTAHVRAKTGTLNGVRSFAGYIEVGGEDYQFVFNFNRPVGYRYREQLLTKLVKHLAQQI